jgi:hypothetical protein
MKFLIFGLVVLAATVYGMQKAFFIGFELILLKDDFLLTQINIFLYKSVADSQSIVEALSLRAEQLLQRARADLFRLGGNGRGELVGQIEHEIRLVARLDRELKSLPFGTELDEQQRHTIEEQLLQHENILAEELRRVEAHNELAPRERIALLQRAEGLLRRARADVARHQGLGNGHLITEIEAEIVRIEELVQELRLHPSATIEIEPARVIEQRLAQHERRLLEELRRIEGN